MTEQYRDSSSPISAQQAQQFYDDGVRVWGIYLGGGTPHIWTNDEAAIPHDAGMALVGYWLPGGAYSYAQGVADGTAAAKRAAGHDVPIAAVSPDIENDYVGQDALDWADGFYDGFRAVDAQTPLAGYGGEHTCAVAYNKYDGLIVAAWQTQNPPPGASADNVPGFDPNFRAGRRIWQDQGGHIEHGADVDSGLADDFFVINTVTPAPAPSPAPITLTYTPEDIPMGVYKDEDDYRRTKIREWYYQIHRRQLDSAQVQESFNSFWQANGADLTLAAIMDSPEGVQNLADERAAVEQAKDLPGFEQQEQAELGQLQQEIVGLQTDEQHESLPAVPSVATPEPAPSPAAAPVDLAPHPDPDTADTAVTPPAQPGAPA